MSATSSDRLAAISVDLDEIDCYAAIHGLGATPSHARHAIYDRALPRLEALFTEHQVSATFFIIGRDTRRFENRAALARLAAAGHELANHTYHHRYDLTRRPRAEIVSDVEAGSNAIAEITGAKPSGFRAPGYTVSDTLFEILEAQGIEYDSSVFPCPAYYGAKAAAITAIGLQGRQSHSVIDDPRVLTAPTRPYRVGRPYWRRGSGPREFPIGVTPLVRLPYIGTSLVLAGPRKAAWLTRAMTARAFVNLELHGIDLAGAEEDGLDFLRPHQPDLRRPLAMKKQTLVRVIQTLRDHGYRFVTLQEAANGI